MVKGLVAAVQAVDAAVVVVGVVNLSVVYRRVTKCPVVEFDCNEDGVIRPRLRPNCVSHIWVDNIRGDQAPWARPEGARFFVPDGHEASWNYFGRKWITSREMWELFQRKYAVY